MEKSYAVPLADLAGAFSLRERVLSSDYETREICDADLNRPGLQLAGYYEYFAPTRIQLLGKAEIFYLRGRTAEEREAALERLLGSGIPAVIVCHRQTAPEECLAAARRHNVSVFETDLDTSEFSAQLIGWLRYHLAPRQTIHGVLVEVHGEGLLITGDSGIGKSETALELVKRGHRLIADDAVELRRVSRVALEGTAPELIRYYMEVRGIGVVNVQTLYGAGAVKPRVNVDLLVALEAWDDNRYYDRLGDGTEETEILGVRVPKITVPVRPGRNLAVILELAAMNNREKKSGRNAAAELVRRVDAQVDAAGLYETVENGAK